MQYSFAGRMQEEDIHIDYKALYEKERAANALMHETIELLKHDLAQFKRMIFGSKSERFVPTDDNKLNAQLSLDLNAETIATCKITEATKVSYVRTKTEVIRNPAKAHPGRMKIPENFRREVIILQPDTTVEGLKKNW